MRLLLAAPALLAACLDAPPGSLWDSGAAGGDGSPDDADAAALSCPDEIGLALTSESDIVGWMSDSGPSCSHAVTVSGLEFTNAGSPSTCRLYRDEALDMRGGQLTVRLRDASSNLNMSVSIVLGPAELPLVDRRWIYFERDEGELRFGECGADTNCDDAAWGSVAYSPETHIWLRFRHERRSDRLHFETSGDTVDWDPHAAVEDVTLEDLNCIGIDLGSYELSATGTTTSSSFSDLAGGFPAAVLTRP